MFKLIKLKNGTRVVLVPSHDTQAVTLLVQYEIGSRYETLKLNGASHYIEHMMFKGTERRPTTMDISRDLDSVGAEYNAFTGKDYTGYYIKLPADQFGLAADMLSDMLHGSLYRETDLRSERNVIIEEIRMYEDNPMMLVDTLMEEELYRGSPLGRSIAGSVETMNGIDRKPLLKYRDEYYVPERTVIAVAGRFDEAAVTELLEKHFGTRPARRSGANYRRFELKKAGYRAPRVKLRTRETEQVQMALGFPAYAYGDERMAALNVMSNILGGTMSSRLFTTVREKAGLAYFVHSSVNPYQDIGNLMVQAGLAKDKFEKGLQLIVRELKRISEKPVAAAELSRAKENIKGRLTLALEDSSRLADWYAKQELLIRKTESPEEKLKKIFAVTPAQVQRVAHDIFRRERMTLALIGPYDKGDKFLAHAKSL
ncbi:MAG: pitrilysin family protein [Patescibacteria group bacterium]|nr:pitrilysin family protein [Patescibacteria group bacterium]